MNRRGFLGAILAAAVAPAIVRADSLMRIVPRELWRPTGHEVWVDEVWVAGPEMTLGDLVARLYDNAANCVFSVRIPNFGTARDIVWPMVTGNEVTSIALTRGGQTQLIREAIGLPVTPNGGDIILTGALLPADLVGQPQSYEARPR